MVAKAKKYLCKLCGLGFDDFRKLGSHTLSEHPEHRRRRTTKNGTRTNIQHRTIAFGDIELLVTVVRRK